MWCVGLGLGLGLRLGLGLGLGLGIGLGLRLELGSGLVFRVRIMVYAWPCGVSSINTLFCSATMTHKTSSIGGEERERETDRQTAQIRRDKDKKREYFLFCCLLYVVCCVLC